MKLEQWRIFAEVADSGSLVRAAQQLGKTPSGVSMSLRQLEKELGGRLFESDRKNQLSELGRIVLREARRNLANFDASVHRIQDYVGAQGHTLRIGAVPSAMQHLLPALIGEYRQQHPHVHLEIRDMDSETLQDALNSQRLDVVVRSHEENIDSPWIQDQLGWVMARHHPLSETGQLSLDEAQAYPLLSNQLCQRSQHKMLRQIDAVADTRVFNTASLLSPVQQDNSITVLPQLAVRQHPNLHFIPLAPTIWRYLKLHTQSKPNTSAQAFVKLAFDARFDGRNLSVPSAT